MIFFAMNTARIILMNPLTSMTLPSQSPSHTDMSYLPILCPV